VTFAEQRLCQTCMMRLPSILLLTCALLTSCATRLVSGYASSASAVGLREDLNTREERLRSLCTDCAAPDGFRIMSVDSLVVLPSCGMDLMSSALSLGLIPRRAPVTVKVTVVGIKSDRRADWRVYKLPLERSTSVWHNLVPSKRDDIVLADALRWQMTHGTFSKPLDEPWKKHQRKRTKDFNGEPAPRPPAAN
jgi:hypothetical protein